MKTEKSSLLSNASKHLRSRLISGVLVLIPLFVTIFVLQTVFVWLTRIGKPLLRPWLGDLNEWILSTLAFIVTVIGLYLVGFIATHLLGKRFIQWGEGFLMRLPLVKPIYSAVKQMVDAFSSNGKNSFEEVVMFEYPRRGIYTIGFVTSIIREPDGKVMYAVFVATTPNPTSGFLILCPEDEVIKTNMPIEDGIKMIVSGGLVIPPACGQRLITLASERQKAKAL
ncbi:MAG: DUF502 domain-containing protein [Lentisphaerae bacterium]|jgi:uncharacterized membrane protein|nr:DUF502 domain-containing protein [Lentisphaerota bacterium]